MLAPPELHSNVTVATELFQPAELGEGVTDALMLGGMLDDTEKLAALLDTPPTCTVIVPLVAP